MSQFDGQSPFDSDCMLYRLIDRYWLTTKKVNTDGNETHSCHQASNFLCIVPFQAVSLEASRHVSEFTISHCTSGSVAHS